MAVFGRGNDAAAIRHWIPEFRGQTQMHVSNEITVRVRYVETDRMGLLHHANYFVYFEMARTELLRQHGISYREIEDAGHFLVIIDINCKFKRPAHYDDLLAVRTTVARVTHVKIVHHYEVLRDGLLLAEGNSTLACVDKSGKPQALPELLR
jgi:acyl-CoA thioester hydrolase